MPLAQRVEPAPRTAAELLAEVDRLYRQLQALPQRPTEHGQRRSPAYTALERQIRAVSEAYWACEPPQKTPTKTTLRLLRASDR